MYEQRLKSVREQMSALGVGTLILGPGADLRYLSGYDAHESERLTALIVPHEGPPDLYVPALEAPRAASARAELRVWTEYQDPLDLVAEAVRASRSDTIVVGDHLWSRFLIGLQERLPGVNWRLAAEALAPVRVLKTSEEIELLRRAGAAADAVWHQVLRLDVEGMTERALAARIAALLEEQGLDGAAFTTVAGGPNSASPHHAPGSRVISRGDTVVVDYGGPLDGYHSDITRALHVGPPDAETQRVYEAVREAQQRGVEAVRPGAKAGDIYLATRSFLESEGLAQYFIHRTGHGLGLEVHEPPYILGGSAVELQEGMVFSVEPGVYIPGNFGVRVEDIVVVTQDGCERLNNAPRELAVL